MIVPICIFAVAQSAPPTHGPIFNVLDYGARNDASSPATEDFAQTFSMGFKTPIKPTSEK